VEGESFQIDLEGIRDFKPMKNPGVIVKEFSFNLPVILEHLRQGDFRESYPPEQTLLAFQQREGLLNVSEINAFTRDFLALSEGEKTLEAIGRELFGKYGGEMQPEEFFEACEEAARVLGEEFLLQPSTDRGSPWFSGGEG
jgi:hypothetical protein